MNNEEMDEIFRRSREERQRIREVGKAPAEWTRKFLAEIRKKSVMQ